MSPNKKIERTASKLSTHVHKNAGHEANQLTRLVMSVHRVKNQTLVTIMFSTSYQSCQSFIGSQIKLLQWSCLFSFLDCKYMACKNKRSLLTICMLRKPEVELQMHVKEQYLSHKLQNHISQVFHITKKACKYINRI